MPIVDLQEVKLTDGLDVFAAKVNLLLENFEDLINQLKIRKESFVVETAEETEFVIQNAPDEETVLVLVDGIVIEDTDYQISESTIVLDEPAVQGQVVKVLYQIVIGV